MMTTPRSLAAVAVLLALAGCREGAPGQTAAVEEAVEVDPCAGLSGFDALRCADPELSQMDDDLAELVNRVAARSSHSARADLRAQQAAWERDRNTCLDVALPKRRGCLDAKYTNRFVEVRQLLELLPD